MWNSEESAVVRIYRSQEHTPSMRDGDKLYQKFQTSKQEAIRLAVALRGFFLMPDLCESQREAYAAYLKRRIRPAAEALIEMNLLKHLMQMEEMGWLDANLTDLFLQKAISQRKSAMIVWLMQLKAQKYGYNDRDFRF